MYCPMSFQSIIVTNNPDVPPPRKVECTPDCAWAFFLEKNYGCSIAYIAASAFSEAFPVSGYSHNSRPLKDDAE